MRTAPRRSCGKNNERLFDREADTPSQRQRGGNPRFATTARHTAFASSPSRSACSTVRPPSSLRT
jgi:hypothetical protein